MDVSSQQSYHQSFFEALAKMDRGRLAALKRNVGESLDTARGVSWFYSLLNRFNVSPYDEESFFLVSTLFASDKDAIDRFSRLNASSTAETPASMNLGESLRRFSGPDEPGDGTARRFGILIDAGFGPNDRELAFRLRQITGLLASKRVPVDWPQLLTDIKGWNRPGKQVQKNWMRSFYRAPKSPVDDPSEI